MSKVQSVKEGAIGCGALLVVLILISNLVQACAALTGVDLEGSSTPVNSTDYVREHGLPADPYDRTPAR
jgi:hypothetical protein